MKSIFRCFVIGLIALTVRAEEPDFAELAGNLLKETFASEDGFAKIAEGLGNLGGSGVLNALQGALSGGGKGLGDGGSLLAALAGALGGAGGGQGGNEGLQLLTSLLPALLNQGHEHSDNPALEDIAKHQQFDMATEKITNTLQIVWGMIQNTEYYKSIVNHPGIMQTGMEIWNQVSGGANGFFDEYYQRLEHPKTRKQLLKSLVSYITMVIHAMPNEEAEKKYIVQFALYINNILKSYGYKEHEMFQLGWPVEDALSQVIDRVAKKELNFNIQSGLYIRPMISKIRGLIAMGRAQAVNSRALDETLMTVLNSELFEGFLKTWRAHKHALLKHECDKHLLCEVNRSEHHDNHVIRPTITAISSVISAWFLSGQTGTPFYELYEAAFHTPNCNEAFPVDCAAFHKHDREAARAYLHTEL